MYSSLVDQTPPRFVTLTNFWTGTFLTAIAALTVPTMVMTGIVLSRLPPSQESTNRMYFHDFPPEHLITYLTAGGYTLAPDVDQQSGRQLQEANGGQTQVTGRTTCNFFSGVCVDNKFLEIKDGDDTILATCAEVEATTYMPLYGNSGTYTHKFDESLLHETLTATVNHDTAMASPLHVYHAYTDDGDNVNTQLNLKADDVQNPKYQANSFYKKLYKQIGLTIGDDIFQRLGATSIHMVFKNVRNVVQIYVTPTYERQFGLGRASLKTKVLTFTWEVTDTKPALCTQSSS